MDFDYDSIVIGAGPAGLSAALMLGRARRRVLVLDSGEPRNHAAREMHGVLGHDGLPPSELRARGIEEIARYGIEVRSAAVDPATARLVDGGIEIGEVRARTLILATGLRDDTPDGEGFDAIYGISAHTCPYCDGWEHRDQKIAVYSPNEEAREHLGMLLRQWSPRVVVLDDAVRFIHDDGRLTAIERAGGEVVEADALFFHVGMHPRVDLAVALGCELNDMGYVAIDPMTRQTTVDRVYAVGNCTHPMYNVPMSVGEGSMAGAQVNMRLVQDGIVQPAPQEVSG